MDEQEFKSLLEYLEMEGWHPYINPIDAHVAGEYPCEECGSTYVYGIGRVKGMVSDNYRAFAVCGECGHAVEF